MSVLTILYILFDGVEACLVSFVGGIAMYQYCGFFARLGRLALLLGAGLLLASCPAPTRAQADNSPYQESFDQEQAAGWNLDTGTWQLGGGLLTGRGHGWATYTRGNWDNMTLSFTLRGLTGTLHASILLADGPSRYLVGLQNLGDSIHVYLERQDGPNTFSGQLAGADFSFSREDFKLYGLLVQITADGPNVRVRLNGETVIEYDDPNRLPGGTIAFETLDNSLAAVDDVSVEPIFQEPPRGECDLTITGAEAVDFLPGSVIIIFRIEIINQGEAPSPPVALVLRDEGEQAFGTTTVDGMNSGESRSVEVRMEAPDSWWDTTHSFIVILDPDSVAPESNRENNTFTIGNVSIPPAPGPGPNPNPFQTPTPGPGPGSNLLILIIIVLVVGGMGVALLGGGGLLLQSSIKAGERKQWEKQAQQGRPPDDCQPSRRHCEVENEIDLKPMRVTQLDFAAADIDSRQERHRQIIKGRVTADLRSVILSHWLGEATDRLTPRIEALSQELAQALVHFFQRDPIPCNLTISAHLEGIEMTSTFTLYRCVGTPPQTSWKKIAKWDVKKQQKRDDLVITLSGKSGADASLPASLTSELFPQLRDYIERY